MPILTVVYVQSLQYGSMLIRNLAFFCMIVLACRRVITAPAASRTTLSQMKLFDLSQLPAAFGGTIYSYMCRFYLFLINSRAYFVILIMLLALYQCFKKRR